MLMLIEKMTGALFIVVGSGGFVFYLLFRQKQKIHQLRDFEAFFHDAVWCMEMKQNTMKEFFEIQSHKGNGMKCLFCEQVYKDLKNHKYPTGEETWEVQFEQRNAEWLLDAWELDMLETAGKYLFGANRMENMDALKVIENQMKEAQKKEKDILLQKQKVFIPVGMMLGIGMIIVLL